MIGLIRRHPYSPALIYFKKIFYFLTFQTFKLPKTVAKKTKNIISMLCTVSRFPLIYIMTKAFLPAHITSSINSALFNNFPLNSNDRTSLNINTTKAVDIEIFFKCLKIYFRGLGIYFNCLKSCKKKGEKLHVQNCQANINTMIMEGWISNVSVLLLNSVVNKSTNS